MNATAAKTFAIITVRHHNGAPVVGIWDTGYASFQAARADIKEAAALGMAQDEPCRFGYRIVEASKLEQSLNMAQARQDLHSFDFNWISNC